MDQEDITPRIPERPKKRPTVDAISDETLKGITNEELVPQVPKTRPLRRTTYLGANSDQPEQLSSGQSREQSREQSLEDLSNANETEECIERNSSKDVVNEEVTTSDENNLKYGNEIEQNSNVEDESDKIGKISGSAEPEVEQTDELSEQKNEIDDRVEPVAFQNQSERIVSHEKSPVPDVETVTNQEEAKESSTESLGKTKSGPPPVPKKPSSRIAAFQQMLQQQQQQEIHAQNKDNSAPKPGFAGNRAQFAQNLNGMIALPGMAQLPPSLAKKLGVSSGNTDNEAGNDFGSEEGKGKKPVHSKRGKGPQKRLPKVVFSMEKVELKSHNDVTVIKSWSISFKPKTCDQTEPVESIIGPSSVENSPEVTAESDIPAEQQFKKEPQDVQIEDSPHELARSINTASEIIQEADEKRDDLTINDVDASDDDNDKTMLESQLETTPTEFIADAYADESEQSSTI